MSQIIDDIKHGKPAVIMRGKVFCIVMPCSSETAWLSEEHIASIFRIEA
jgi:hypothetical protein